MHMQGHAIVIGASISGLLAARALADHFERVTLLERDAIPPAGENRKGVPQGHHAHGLLAQGRISMEQLLPGLTTELEAAGAARGDLADDARWHLAGDFHCRFKSGIKGLLVSRPLLEATVRRRVLALPNVTLQPEVDVTGLTASPDSKHVTGVRLRRLCGDGEQALAADLVVDASGRGSRLPGWLSALGYAPPQEERVDIGLSYTTRVYRRAPEHAGGARAIVLAASRESRRTGALLFMEGERWILTVGGYRGDPPGAGEAALLDFARSLPAPQFAEVASQAEPLTHPKTFRYPANVRRRYERLARFPQGLLAIGDAIASFNPVYGQGMTVAALEAQALAAELACGKEGLARRFFRRAAKLVDVPWTIAVGNDARLLDIREYNGFANRLINGYLDLLHRAARTDAVLSLAFHRVANLMASPASLFAPAIVARVLLGNLLPRRFRAASPLAMTTR
ncbi:monooxygenase [Betaproteobacteria bacterium PRO7]|nr:monooxygenase [Betaproteobacteria bacterium PRO7]